MADYHKTVDGMDTRGGIAPSDIPVEVRDKNYVHTQGIASDVWKVSHNLEKFPSVTILDTENRQQFAYTENIDINNLRIEFTYPCCGKVICN